MKSCDFRIASHERVTESKAHRWWEFNPAARAELFGELAAHFHAKVEFPPEATDGVADEQFLRNVVDLVYRGKN